MAKKDKGEAATPEGTSFWAKLKGWFTRAKDSEAAEKAGEIAEKTWEKTKDVSGKTWEKTKDVSGKTWEKTKEVSGEVKEKVDEKLEERRAEKAETEGQE